MAGFTGLSNVCAFGGALRTNAGREPCPTEPLTPRRWSGNAATSKSTQGVLLTGGEHKADLDAFPRQRHLLGGALRPALPLLQPLTLPTAFLSSTCTTKNTITSCFPCLAPATGYEPSCCFHAVRLASSLPFSSVYHLFPTRFAQIMIF